VERRNARRAKTVLRASGGAGDRDGDDSCTAKLIGIYYLHRSRRAFRYLPVHGHELSYVHLPNLRGCTQVSPCCDDNDFQSTSRTHARTHRFIRNIYIYNTHNGRTYIYIPNTHNGHNVHNIYIYIDGR